MATLANNSSGNFTTAATWSLVDATSLLDSETNTTNTTTAFVSSSAFTPGVITIDGIGIKVSARSASPTGTFSVRLHDGTAAVTGTTVTINVADITAVNGSTNNGWVFMKFAAPVLLIIATAYTVQVQSSTTAQVTLYRNATAANWSRFLRTTTTQAPVAADVLYVIGEKTGAGASTSYTVTNDNTATTIFGEIEVAGTGTLASGVAAATNYYLKVAGNLTIYTNGTYSQGTSAIPVPSTSTSKLEFSNASNVEFGLEVRLGGTLKTGGNPLTYNSAILSADAAAAATSLTTDVSTGWLSGDVIGIASTTRTRTEAESKALTANAAGTTLTITALTNAHSGTDATMAELINLTRNVSIFGTSTANQAYINVLGTSIVDMHDTEIYNMGSATASKRGIDLGTNTGSATITGCSIHDFVVASSIGLNINSATGNNYTITNNVFYGIATIGVNVSATTNNSYTINNIIVMAAGQTAASTGFTLADVGGTITNLTGTSCQGTGITISDNANTSAVYGTLSNWTAHSNSTIGISFSSTQSTTNTPTPMVTTLTSWRNNTTGINLSNCFNITLDTLVAFGNTTANLGFGGTELDNIIVKNGTFNAGTTLTCPTGLNINGSVHETYLDNCTFGGTTTHATADVNVSATLISVRVVLRNCVRSSATKLTGTGNFTEGSFIASARDQQTSGSHLMSKRYGTIAPDTVIFNSASPSARMTPNSATQKLSGATKKVAVNSGGTVVIHAFVRKSVAGDGTAYNGNQPRLMLRADPAVGITSDTVIATATNAANGAFEHLSGTTSAASDDAVMQFYIDCDGTTGWVNVDDWSVNS